MEPGDVEKRAGIRLGTFLLFIGRRSIMGIEGYWFWEQILYAADEFYLCAKCPIPTAEFYGEFVQQENGVGLISCLNREFYKALQEDVFPLEQPSTVIVATGVAAYDFIKGLLDELSIKCHNLTCDEIVIKNDFFGHNITVAGLVTKGDIIRQLKGWDLGDAL